jgi:hypothetical protein
MPRKYERGAAQFVQAERRVTVDEAKAQFAERAKREAAISGRQHSVGSTSRQHPGQHWRQRIPGAEKELYRV